MEEKNSCAIGTVHAMHKSASPDIGKKNEYSKN